MKFSLKAKSTKELITQYLTLTNALFNFTPVEISIIVELYLLKQKAVGTPEDILNEWLLSTNNRKKIQTTLEISASNFNVVLHRLKEKTISGAPALELKFLPASLTNSFKISIQGDVVQD